MTPDEARHVGRVLIAWADGTKLEGVDGPMVPGRMQKLADYATVRTKEKDLWEASDWVRDSRNTLSLSPTRKAAEALLIEWGRMYMREVSNGKQHIISLLQKYKGDLSLAGGASEHPTDITRADKTDMVIAQLYPDRPSWVGVALYEFVYGRKYNLSQAECSREVGVSLKTYREKLNMLRSYMEGHVKGIMYSEKSTG